MDSRVRGNDGLSCAFPVLRGGLVPRSLPEDAGYKPALPGRFVTLFCEK